jgi:hypothetical protein
MSSLSAYKHACKDQTGSKIVLSRKDESDSEFPLSRVGGRRHPSELDQTQLV